MIPKRFEDIEFSDLEALLNNQVAEGKTIEYKEIIPSNADSDKAKFLAGVSAFANTIGGDFLIGIKAKDGIPTKLSGLTLTDSELDAEILRLEQMLQNSLEPRLPSFSIKDDLKSPTGENFILIRVNRSWIAPHKVKVNEKFYGRNSKGKYPLDVSELRTAFMLTEQLSERIKNFRSERIHKIQNNDETPVLLNEGGKIVLHLLPLSAFATSVIYDISELNKKIQFGPISSSSWDKRINLDGIVVSRKFDSNTNSYTQVFRNGCIEAVNCLSWNDDDQDYSARYDEEQIIKALSEYITLYINLEIDLPIYLFLTFLDVKGYKFHLDDDFRRVYEIQFRIRELDKPVLNRNILMLPEIMIDDFNLSASEILRPILDLVWNSVGFSRDYNYDDDGNWIENFRNFYPN